MCILSYLDQNENIVEVVPNVLLHNGNEKSQLLHEEIFLAGFSCFDHVDETRNNLSYERDTFDTQRFEYERYSLRNQVWKYLSHY